MEKRVPRLTYMNFEEFDEMTPTNEMPGTIKKPIAINQEGMLSCTFMPGIVINSVESCTKNLYSPYIFSTPKSWLSLTPPSQPAPLPLNDRQARVERYREKKKRRITQKRIIYDCRKKVADKRLRVKGRFVTKDQAYKMLGLSIKDLSESINSSTIDEVCSNFKIRNLGNLLNP